MRPERVAPLSGVVAVVLWVVGAYLLEKDDRPDGKDTSAFVEWVVENDTAIVSGAIAFGFGTLFFLWLLGSLRVAIAEAEGGAGRLASLAFGSGVALCVALMFTYLPHAQGAYDHANTSDTAVEALVRVGDAFFGGAILFSIPLFVASGLAALRHAALPRWFGWASLAVALLLALPGIQFLALVAGLPLWTLAVTGLLYRRSGSGGASKRSTIP